MAKKKNDTVLENVIKDQNEFIRKEITEEIGKINNHYFLANILAYIRNLTR